MPENSRWPLSFVFVLIFYGDCAMVIQLYEYIASRENNPTGTVPIWSQGTAYDGLGGEK